MNISEDGNSTEVLMPEISGRILVAVQVVTVILLLGSIWAFSSFLFYGIRKRAWKRRRNRTMFILMTLATVAPIFTFIRFSLTQALIIAGRSPPGSEHGAYICSVVSSIHITAYTLSLFPVYCFLWYRQRTLYSKPSLRHLNTRVINTVSIAVLPLMIVGLASVSIMFLFADHKVTNVGCTFRLKPSLGSIPLYVLIVVTSLVQLLLFILFLYPLRNYAGGDQVRVGEEANRKRTTGKRVRRLIRLASFSIIGCVLSDMMAMGITRLLATFYGRNTMLSIMIYDVNLLVNIISIMFSFENHQKIGLSACYSWCGQEGEFEIPPLTGSRRHRTNHSSTNI